MTEKKDSINLDLINMVQNARMMHDDTAKPSQVPGVYWIEAKRKAEGDYPTLTPQAGEWRIPTTVSAVDEQWATIKQATEAGELGYKSKVSTVPAHGQTKRDDRLICVRTYSADDTQDVHRVESALKNLGFDSMTYVRISE